MPPADPALPRVLVLGLGYVGLPTVLSLAAARFPVLGLDRSPRRLTAIRAGQVDLIPEDLQRLQQLVGRGDFLLTDDPEAIGAADVVLIAVPTPVDHRRRPDLRILRAACAQVVDHACPGQLLLLTSTTHVGSTRQLLCEPLIQRGLQPGQDIHVAFAPERINPGDTSIHHEQIPRVYGAVSEHCAELAQAVLEPITSQLERLSSPEAAEATKLYENTFRAVNLALANEMADICAVHGLDPVEITQAAATKPYGFLAHYPGPGVGGHCIPCDPHYLLQGIDQQQLEAPLIHQAMELIHCRPARVAERALRLLSQARARVLVSGITYKPGAQDVRESPALEILQHLQVAGAQVAYHDPLVPPGAGPDCPAVLQPRPEDWDLVVLTGRQPGTDYGWLEACPQVLDCTYRWSAGAGQEVYRP